MKIYKHQPLYLIQLTFRRGKEHVLNLTLCGTDISLTKALMQDLFQPGVKKDKAHLKTRIEIRERLGGKNGKYTAHSFYGESAAKTRQTLINHLNNNK
jgi:hypothetical protein